MKEAGEQREGNDEQEGTDSCGVIILYVCESTGFRVDCKNAWVNDIFIALVHEILEAAITHAQQHQPDAHTSQNVKETEKFHMFAYFSL